MPGNTITWKLVDEIAAELGATEGARMKWRQPKRGVPLRWRIKIAEYLTHRMVPVSFGDFDELPENPGRVAA